jgi:hypothetical protein
MTVYLGLGLALAASGALNIILLSVLGRRMREDAAERDLDWVRAPHGRLIDADALKEQLNARRCSPCKRPGSMCWACWVHDAETEIDDAPTVIQAEEATKV